MLKYQIHNKASGVFLSIPYFRKLVRDRIHHCPLHRKNTKVKTVHHFVSETKVETWAHMWYAPRCAVGLEIFSRVDPVLLSARRKWRERVVGTRVASRKLKPQVSCVKVCLTEATKALYGGWGPANKVLRPQI